MRLRLIVFLFVFCAFDCCLFLQVDTAEIQRQAREAAALLMAQQEQEEAAEKVAAAKRILEEAKEAKQVKEGRRRVGE